MRVNWPPLRSMLAMAFAVAVVGIMCFPPWVVTNHAGTLRVGWGTPLGPRLSEVANSASSCGGPVAEAREQYLAAQRDDQQEKERDEIFERMRAEASEAVKSLRARGLDPTKYDTAGAPVHCKKTGLGESCDRLSADTESGAESPFPSSDRAQVHCRNCRQRKHAATIRSAC